MSPPTDPARMHRYDEGSAELAQAVFDYVADRTQREVPLDGPRPAAELSELVGASVTKDGLGWEEALRRFTEVLAKATISMDHPLHLAYVPAAGTLALEALRIAAWRPRLSTEVDEKTIPHELDWLRSAVHLNKGCYRGQETVAKVHNLGHPPRRLVMLHLDGSEGVLPGPGDPVLLPSADDSAPTEVGRITSAAIHHELGPIALAVIKRNVDPAADLVVAADGAQVAAAQEVIVPTDAGAEANVPRLPRLGAVRR